MYKNKKILAIIPARGGSKRLLRKNIRLFCRRPLLAWTIQEAKRSKYIDRIIVSTEDKAVARIAKAYGAEVPFRRPLKLALDSASSSAVILHTLKWLKDNERSGYDYFILLQPTSPLRKATHIDQAIKMVISDPKLDALVSVYRPNFNAAFLKKINGNDYLGSFLEQKHSGKFMMINGAIYIAKISKFQRSGNFYQGNCVAYIMNSQDSVDIDTLDDWNYAQYLMRKRKG